MHKTLQYALPSYSVTKLFLLDRLTTDASLELEFSWVTMTEGLLKHLVTEWVKAQ